MQVGVQLYYLYAHITHLGLVLTMYEVCINVSQIFNYEYKNNIPPAAKMRARAFSVTCSAATVIFGTVYSLTSLVMEPTTTAIMPSRVGFFMWRAKRDKESGGLLIRLINRRRRIIWLNLAFVRLAKYLYSWKTMTLLGYIFLNNKLVFFSNEVVAWPEWWCSTYFYK